MRHRTVLIALLCLLAPAAAQDTLLGPRVTYTVDATDPGSGAVVVEMRIEGVREDSLTLGMAVWRPGSYRFQNYPERVVEFAAVDSGGADLRVSHPRRDRWVVASAGADPVVVRYRLEPGARGDRGSEGVRDDHYDIDGPGTYIHLLEHMHLPHRATFRHPDGWRIATGLDSWVEAGVTWYGARDYDTFADCPTEISDHALYEFTVDDVLYQIMIHGPTDWDVPAFVEIVRRIVTYEMSLFGGAPFRRYVFFYHLENRAGGYGLEHLNSTTIYMPAILAQREPESLASITAHEFFHLWNVKRIRPARLGPFDYSRDNRVRELWFCEGVTSYYAAMTLARTGLWTEEELLAHMAGQIRAQETSQARDTMSLEDSSWTIWDETEDEPRVSYYTKGQIVGWLLDLEMRRRTDGRVSLDTLMSFLYRWFVLGGDGPIGEGFQEGDLLRAVNALTGSDFSEFFERFVAGVDPLPYAEVLAAAGYSIELDLQEAAYWGIALREADIRRITRRSPAETAGLRRGDTILAVNGEAVTAESLAQRLEEGSPGDAMTIRIRRDGAESDVALTAALRRTGVVRVRPAEGASEEALGLRRGWLEGGTGE